MRLDEQVCKCLTGTSTHTSADVMQLRQPEFVGIVHDKSVHIGHVNAGLYDRRAYQHVRFALVETGDHTFQLVFIHLAMPY